MLRWLVPLITLIVGFAAGYELAHYKDSRNSDASFMTAMLHSSLNEAALTGQELDYLQDASDGKAALFMRLRFCASVEEANKLISQGAIPFPIQIDTEKIQKGRERVRGYQTHQCDASVGQLLNAIPKLQSRYNPMIGDAWRKRHDEK